MSASESARGAWFQDARFGLFVHWGLYAVLGRGEWIRNRESVPDDEYESLVQSFDAAEFDTREWARMAKQAGMRYAVLTTKHHEGFCLWDSRTCAFNALNSAANRDLVREFVEAFRAEGLRVGLYYSLGDWHNPDWKWAVHGDEPARVRFVAYTRDLVRELMSQYGRIDVLWYDLPQGLTAEQWEADSLNAMVRELQPEILINNRSLRREDFSILEQSLHGAPENRMWETCLTLNGSWGFNPADHDFKSPRKVASTLATIAKMGGNLLLNVGPDAHGRVPEASQAILREVGTWLDRNGEAIFGTSGFGLPFNLWGTTTARAHAMYLFLECYFGCELVIGGLEPNVLDAQILGANLPLSVERRGRQTILRGLPCESPDPVLTVVRLTLDGPPDQSLSRDIAGSDIMVRFPD
jgi:alpha-L-fucosidase